MNKLCRIAFVVGLTVLAACLFSYLSGPPEPKYQGKKLSAWLEDFAEWDGSSTNTPFVEAVRALGTDAVPAIVKMALAQDSKVKRDLSFQWEKHPKLVRYRFTTAPERWARANNALSIMGRTARSAGPAFVIALTNQDAIMRRCGANALGAMGAEAEQWIPALIECQYDMTMRDNVMRVLGEIGRKPEVCVPVLIVGLGDTNPAVRQFAAISLGKFGNTASAAVPALTKVLKDPHVYNARMASLALTKIQTAQAETNQPSPPQ